MNPYYQPYWSCPDELEHYGVKGMKWRKTKNRSVEELKGVGFGDVKVSETLNYFKANPIKTPKIWNSETKTLNIPKVKMTKTKSTLAKIKSGLNSIKRMLNEFGKNPIKALNKKK